MGGRPFRGGVSCRVRPGLSRDNRRRPGDGGPEARQAGPPRAIEGSSTAGQDCATLARHVSVQGSQVWGEGA